MKRYFKIGGGILVCSITPIISWLLLAIIVGDSRIANVFSITYSLQCAMWVMIYFFGVGANIRKEKEKDENAVGNSLFWGLIFSTIIMLIPIILVDKYLIFYGLDVQLYKPYVIYAIIFMTLQMYLYFLAQKWYYEDRESKATIHMALLNLTAFVCLIVGVLIFKNINIYLGLLLSIVPVLVYLIVLYVKNFPKFKFDLKLYRNFRYQAAQITSYTLMMLSYLFGLQNAFAMGEQYMAALNLSILCCDIQWDMTGAMDTVVEVDIAKGRDDYKKLFRQSYIYISVLLLSIFAMAFSLFSIYNVRLELLLLYLSFDALDMILNPIYTIYAAYIQLEYSATLSSILNLFGQAVRFLISTFLLSAFCTGIGQITETILAITAFVIIRLVKFKANNNRIVLKTKLQAVEKSE